jgi:signal transduction histidine kinase
MPPRPSAAVPRWDTWLVFAATALSGVLAAHFNWNESLYSLTRHEEYFQVDEWPIGILVLLVGLMWLSWRRYRHACRELGARQAAEARLTAVLAANRELAHENLRIQEVERKHLARELHDELGQYLNAIKLDAVSITEQSSVDPRLAMDAASAIIRSADHVHAAVSGMIARLRPVGLDELGLIAAIEHCVDEWRPRLPTTRFALSVRGDFEGLGERLNLTVYRLIQEGLTNIYKHANARNAEIILERLESGSPGRGGLRLRVADDGCGMRSAARTSRFGVSGMRERVEMEGGTFMVTSSPGHGCQFEALLPAMASADG